MHAHMYVQTVNGNQPYNAETQVMDPHFNLLGNQAHQLIQI